VQKENARRIAILAAALVAAAILGSLLIPTTAIGVQNNSSKSQIYSMPGMPDMPMPTPTGPVTASVKSGSWSDTSVWSNGVPTAGINVMIAPGTTVAYDQASSPVVRNVEIAGSLIFSTSVSTSFNFVNMTIDQGGLLQAGKVDTPVPAGVTTKLAVAAQAEGGSTIMVLGDLELHGSPVNPTWTRLAATVQLGATTLTLASSVNWKPGDHIVVASTSLLPQESEENWITSVSGNTVTLQTPLKYEHDGTSPTQGEVADLSRNVVVTSYNTAVHAAGVMFLAGAKGGLSYAEFSHLGGKGIVGDYPIHFHHVQETMVGTIVNGVSVWDSHNRFITIHNTDGVTVENSVGYKSIGHGFFLEDGTEENNTLYHNLAVLTLPGVVRPDDGSPAGFWIQNPDNNFTDNVAVSAGGSGFDLALPESAPSVIPFRQANFDESLNQATNPRSERILAFVGNVAHSNRGDGIHLYRLNMVRNGPINWFKGLTMWRNGFGVDLTAAQFNVTSSTLFGNLNGNMRIEANDGTVTNSQFLGEVAPMVTNRIMISPFGIEVTAGRATISNSLFKGHLPRGTLASADILNAPMAQSPEAVTLSNDQLLSSNQIIFGYPLNGMSYFNVLKLNGDPTQNFSLVRYDLQTSVSSSSAPASPGLVSFIGQCTPDSGYMALKCPVITASMVKSLHG